MIFKLSFLLFVSSAITVCAQRLPNKQEISIVAPTTVKIDGKATEWGDKFQAYNQATEIYYRIANDEKNIYLVVQAAQPNIINKIIAGGITFSIKTIEKKNPSKQSFTFPMPEKPLYFNLTKKKDEVQDTTAKTVDSIMQRNNSLLEKYCKSIKVIGVNGIDTIISIYNINGIKAAGLFNNLKNYIYELSIPIKLIDAIKADSHKISYQIRLNGATAMKIGALPVQNIDSETKAFMEKLVSRAVEISERNSAPTDFQGEYILIKKNNY